MGEQSTTRPTPPAELAQEEQTQSRAEGLTDEQGNGTLAKKELQRSSSSNQSSEPTIDGEEGNVTSPSSIQGPAQGEEPEVASLNQTGNSTQNVTTTASNATASNAIAATNTTSGAYGRIAFGGDGGSDSEIYVMNPDGSGVTRLTNNNEYDRHPALSPDGKRIAFFGERDGKDEIWVMNAADGSGQIRLTADGYDPSWSPDGKKIAFVRNSDGDGEIYVMNAADGSEQTKLTNNTEFDFDPAWSSDSKKIAFSSVRDNNNEIYVMNAADGSNKTRITEPRSDYSFPDWAGGNISSHGGGSPAATPSPGQAINKVISTIQNLDNIPQNLKTSIIAHLRQALNSLNETSTNIINNFNVP